MKVAVVGLGAAGLRACMLLEAQGAEIVGFEARNRFGGRLQTIRTERGFFEAGGEWIDENQSRILELLKEMGKAPFVVEDGVGKQYFCGEFVDELDHESDFDQFYTAADLAVLDLEETPWENVIYGELDDRPLSNYLAEHVKDRRAREILTAVIRSEEGEELERIGTLGWLTGYEFYRSRGEGGASPLKFPDGATAFCEWMASRIKGKLHLSTVVEKISLLEDGLWIEAGDRSERVDRVVITAPPCVAARIAFEPGLPEAKLEALEAFPLGRTIKVSMHFRSRWWARQGWNGRFLSDLPLQQCWDGSRGQEAVLLAYLCGDAASEALAAPDPVQFLLDCLAQIAPECRQEFLSGEVHDWIGDPWSSGGFPRLEPGAVLGHWRTLIEPTGGVHWAGDAASRWIGYIEGALESAERVTKEILGE